MTGGNVEANLSFLRQKTVYYYLKVLQTQFEARISLFAFYQRHQCDQIELFLKVNSNKFSSDPFCDILKNHTLKVKSIVATSNPYLLLYFWQLLERFGQL